MEQLNTILLGTISTLLGITLYVLSGMNDKIKDLKKDIVDRLDKIDQDIDNVWNNIRNNSTRIAVVETKLELKNGENKHIED